MDTRYRARRISKTQADVIRRSGQSTSGVLLECFNGRLVVEPVSSTLGDGEVLTAQEADYELSPAWCPDPLTKIRRARQLLGLETAN